LSNPLDTIMDWYDVTLDSLRVTSRVIEREIKNAILEKHTFSADSPASGLSRIESAKQQVADLTVLSLVSLFERTLRDYLSERQQRLSAPGLDDVDARARQQVLEDLEFWKLSDEVMKIFAGTVGPNLIGQVKQAIDYRNWVAHGRSTNRPPRSNVVPQFAYRALTDFLSQAGIV
jgi:hypothetical protein